MLFERLETCFLDITVLKKVLKNENILNWTVEVVKMITAASSGVLVQQLFREPWGLCALPRTLRKCCSSYLGTLEAVDKGGCFHFWEYCTTPALLCSTFKQKYCRHLGCFLRLWKMQVLLVLSISSDSACYHDELHRCAALGILTVTKEGQSPFLRAWEVTVRDFWDKAESW